MAIYQFYKEQIIPASMEAVWDFLTSPNNLKRISPEYMDFRVTSKYLPEKMYPGMMIQYKIKPLLGISVTWVTEITQVKEKAFFVDEQRVGPYKMWHHEHKVFVVEGGVKMVDLLTYQPPMGFLGRIANRLFIRKKLDEIFTYRYVALEEIFGKSPS